MRPVTVVRRPRSPDAVRWEGRRKSRGVIRMTPVELRDLADARRFVVQGLWLQGVARPTDGSVRTALEWALSASSDGRPLLPVGVIADVGYAAFDATRP